LQRLGLLFNVSEFLSRRGGIETQYFFGHFLDEPYGILGMKSGKWAVLQEMLNLQYLMMPVGHPFSAFIQKVLHQN
jgi:hypothetical protein